MHSSRSFSGQGNEVWENAPKSRNPASNDQPPSNIRGSLGNSVAADSEVHSGASRSANSNVSAAPQFRKSVLSGVPASNRSASFGNAAGSGNLNFEHRGGTREADRDGDRDDHRGGCWNCGFGGGFAFVWWPGWGFGGPWLGYSSWDPFYWNNMSWGWPGYDYYGYPARYPNGYDYNNNYGYSNDGGSSYSAPDYNSVTADPSSPPEASSEQDSTQTGNVAISDGPVTLYMKDGSVYSARDYWFSGDQFHYVLIDGQEGVVDAEKLDMQRTNEENAKSGVRFVVKSDPN